jgi:hypothetical protein
MAVNSARPLLNPSIPSFTDIAQGQQSTAEAPTNTSPGRSHGDSFQSHQPGLIERAPLGTRFEFEVAEVEEADYEMAGNQ